MAPQPLSRRPHSSSLAPPQVPPPATTPWPVVCSGGRGIRTPGGKPTTVFKTAAIVRSAIPPWPKFILRCINTPRNKPAPRSLASATAQHQQQPQHRARGEEGSIDRQMVQGYAHLTASHLSAPLSLPLAIHMPEDGSLPRARQRRQRQHGRAGEGDPLRLQPVSQPVRAHPALRGARHRLGGYLEGLRRVQRPLGHHQRGPGGGAHAPPAGPTSPATANSTSKGEPSTLAPSTATTSSGSESVKT